MDINEFQNIVGYYVFWLSAILGSLILIGILTKKLLNYIGRNYRKIWIIIEYLIYREEFKEFMKDKERHEKLKDGN